MNQDPFRSGENFTLIAGPCMLESMELAEQVIEHILPLCRELRIPYIFKSSFDKANRTSSKSQRGPGLQRGLQQLDEIKRKYKVPVLTDIHTPEQAAQAAEIVDVLQIPAFLCEDRALLQAAAKTKKAINLKKAQFLPPERMRALHRYLLEQGAGPVGLCERGTSFGYHNLIVDFRSLDVMRSTGAAVVFDATHAAQLPGAGQGVSSGKREHIPTLARAAAAAGVDAFFMEVHTQPTKALSDKDTQLAPTEAIPVIRSCLAVHRCVRSLSHRDDVASLAALERASMGNS